MSLKERLENDEFYIISREFSILCGEFDKIKEDITQLQKHINKFEIMIEHYKKTVILFD